MSNYVEELAQLAIEIQHIKSLAFKLIFSDEEEDTESDILHLNKQDLRLLYVKLENIATQVDTLGKDDLPIPFSDSVDMESPVIKAGGKKYHHVVSVQAAAGRSKNDAPLNLESRGGLRTSDSVKSNPSDTYETISIGNILYPQHRTGNVIKKIISGIVEYLDRGAVAQASSPLPARINNVRNRSDDNSELSIASGSKSSQHSPMGQSISIDGHSTRTKPTSASPGGHIRGNRSPSGRRHGGKPRQHGMSSNSKEKILYARTDFSNSPVDRNSFTIYSATGVDKGVNTVPMEETIKESAIAGGIHEDHSMADHSIISQISFPESIPPKNKYVLDATYAHFPELGVPSSPYAARPSMVPDPRVVKELKDSPNPLATLYNQYWQFIPSVFRARLLSTAATHNEHISTRDSLSLLFESVLKEIEKLELCLNICSKGIDHCQKLSQGLIVAGERRKLSEEYQKALSQLLINIAEIEVSAVWADLQLTEYRDLFQKFHHLGILNLTQTIKKCSSYRMSQHKFVACEKTARSLLDRVLHVKSQWSTTLRVPPQQLFVSEADVQIRLNSYIDAIDQLRSENRALQQKANESKKNLKRACDELMETQLQIDRTPNALLFYVTLLDPAILPSLHTIVDEIKTFKSFIMGETHFEYTSVRRGLEACTMVLPYVQRFLLRFQDLKKKWTKERIGKFTVMGLTGGDADATSVCPLCDADTRMFDRHHDKASSQQHK